MPFRRPFRFFFEGAKNIEPWLGNIGKVPEWEIRNPFRNNSTNKQRIK